ncbi:hypothetical protein [Pandoraea apista]|uniref:Cell envelope biogenesis protein TolA n=1 Tax=Pandoraea apista TaxID=93218 RepID=A0A5E5PA45_9BURK|nr:hypothetical protein [Pandoraea apista]AJE99069.1 hypothetical protein SG18_14345 [Pandoraea apista]AKH73165.1 hypothetical protein XM39_14540 [Pandoraea apista]AKI61561.1 hypothetical protein AA956_06880 [Pandoraea apista]ALS65372.2 hypothetical protein AT395_10535 [Pandoraea apista]OXS94174.1 hypothetical protein B7H01_11795 [Pandoraea apista]
MSHRIAMNFLTCACLAAGAAGMMGTTVANAADAATKDRYDAAQKSAEADYKASVARCEDLKDNAKKVCVENAKGNEKVAKANAEADYKQTPKARYDAAIAKADADYSVAKLRCDDKKGNEKDVCVKDADAAKTKAYGDAKVMRTSRESSKDTMAAREDANADANKAQYKAALERCDSLSGNSKDACVADAKARFHQ